MAHETLAAATPRVAITTPRYGLAGYIGLHCTAIAGAFYLGISGSGAILALTMHSIFILFVTIGHHRYFSHRSFKTSRIFQFILAFGATATGQKGVLWWGAHHRDHHRHSDRPGDPHSPVVRNLWKAYYGWTSADGTESIQYRQVRDLAKYPELVWLDRYMWLPPVAVGAGFLIFGGLHGLVWGSLWGTVLSLNLCCLINILGHRYGEQVYETEDNSRNSWWMGLITFGEGFHNNHHHTPGSARMAYHWYQIDISYYVLLLLQSLRIVWDLNQPDRRRTEHLPSQVAPISGP